VKNNFTFRKQNELIRAYSSKRCNESFGSLVLVWSKTLKTIREFRKNIVGDACIGNGDLTIFCALFGSTCPFGAPM